MITRGVEAVSAHLRAEGVSHEVIEHDRTLTAVAEAEVTTQRPDEVAKTIVLRDGAVYLLAVIPGSERLDVRKLRDVLGAGRSRGKAMPPPHTLRASQWRGIRAPRGLGTNYRGGQRTRTDSRAWCGWHTRRMTRRRPTQPRLARFLSGSVSAETVRTARYPVIVVPFDERSTPRPRPGPALATL